MAKDYVIYISTHAVQVICGSSDKEDMIKIFNFDEIELQEGAMINGVIMDDSLVTEALIQIKNKGVKKARLVIDSGQILLRNLVVPFVSKKELMKYTIDELSNINESYEDLIYDYGVLRNCYVDGEQSKGEILCCGIERKLLSSYIEIFHSAGIKLKSIDIAVNVLQKFAQELSELDGKTYIVSVLDANNVTSYLFENNCYAFSNRARLFSERGTEAFQNEMVSSISQLIQFSKAKHSTYTIENAYFCGLNNDEETGVYNSIMRNLKISAEKFPNSSIVCQTNYDQSTLFELHNYVLPVGCLIRK